MDLAAALTEYHFTCDAKNIGKRTWAWYEEKLTAFFLWCEKQEVIAVDGITTPLVRRYLVALQGTANRYGQPISSYTIHGYAQVIKGFLRWAAAEDLLDAQVAQKVALPRVEQKILETFSDQQLAALFAACTQTRQKWIAVRDRAILSVLLDTGIRASELCSLTMDRVFFAGDDPYLRLQGKGRKQREVGLGKKSRLALHKYLYRARPAVADVHVFVSFKETPLTAKGLDDLLRRVRDRAQITGVRCSAHTFRHTYAVRYLQGGGDIYRLSRLLGHTSVTTTEIYLRAFKDSDSRNGQSVLDQMH